MTKARLDGVLVISGLPGTGKSVYARWLEQRGWGRVSVDELLGRASVSWSRLERAVVAAINGDDGALRTEAATYPGVVVEWGFHTNDLGRLVSMVERGYVAWYFDGARPAALAGWRNAHPGEPEGDWHAQVRKLDDAWSQIQAAYGENLIETVNHLGVYLAPEEIDGRIGLRRDRVDSTSLPDAQDRLQG